MARSRNIKPGFFTNDRLAELPPLARILFPGLWCIADKEGRLEDRPRRIAAQILPYDQDADVEELLGLLAAGSDSFIVRYQVDGERFIQIRNWDRHQRPHWQETASVIPAMPEEPASVNVDSSMNQACDNHDSSMGDSSTVPRVKGIRQEGISNKESALGAASSGERRGRLKKPPAEDADFIAFWAVYPKRVAKEEARTAFAKAVHRLTDSGRANPAAMLVERAKAFGVAKQDADPKFIPHPATWLNKGQFDDDPATWVECSQRAGPSSRASNNIDQAKRFIEEHEGKNQNGYSQNDCNGSDSALQLLGP
jgi:hypothetical protein